MSGNLYGVGLGPGDPELMTLKAHRLVSNADVVAYPVLESGESFARSIAAQSIRQGCPEISIRIPMSTEREPAQAAYDRGAQEIAIELDAGKDVVVLCEGDPFFYGSFMYLYSRLSADYPTQVIPGVTSVTACAARAGQPLSARNDVLTILPGTLSEEDLTKKIDGAEALAIMKVGRHLPKISRVISQLGLTGKAHYIERATLDVEKISKLADAPEKAPYFSMILINKGQDPWL